MSISNIAPRKHGHFHDDVATLAILWYQAVTAQESDFIEG